MPRTRCRTRSSSPRRSSPGCATPSGCAPGCSPWRRNECLHRLKSRREAAPLQDAPELADDSVDVGADAERAETVALVRAAIGGLNDGERDVIHQLWHGLEVSEVAAVLGVSRNHAYALFSRARDQLEASVAVLLVGRAGRRDCAVLDGMLADWDGRLTARLRRRVATGGAAYRSVPGVLRPAAAGTDSRPALRPQPGGAARHGGPARRRRAARAARPGARRGAAADRRGRPCTMGQRWPPGGRSMHSFSANGFPRPVHPVHLGLLPRHLPVAGVTTTAAAAAATPRWSS